MSSITFMSRLGQQVTHKVIAIEDDQLITDTGLLLQVQNRLVWLSGGHNHADTSDFGGVTWVHGTPHYYTPPKMLGELMVME